MDVIGIVGVMDMIVGVVDVEIRVEMDAEETRPAAIPHPPPHPSLHPLPNQSKPIVPLLSFSFIITFSYIFITISYNL